MDCSSTPIIFYDGVCGLCNGFNQFVLKRDRRDCFRFASLQSEFATDVLTPHKVNAAALNAIYVLLNHGRPDERLLAQSDAVIYVLRSLTKVWRTVGLLLRVVPKPLRNKAYELVARNRYRLFGKHAVCPIPSAERRKRFIDL